MAYENGYAVMNYIGATIESYRTDSHIFAKAASFLQLFLLRKDWPHCYQELDQAITMVLAQPLSYLLEEFAEKYLDDPKMEWPMDIPARFQDEFRVFYLTVSPLLQQCKDN